MNSDFRQIFAEMRAIMAIHFYENVGKLTKNQYTDFGILPKMSFYGP